jgi:hypothetical protein
MVELLRQGPQRFLDGWDIPTGWWELFESPALNALVEHALKAREHGSGQGDIERRACSAKRRLGKLSPAVERQTDLSNRSQRPSAGAD